MKEYIKNPKVLYLIIGILAVLNIASLSYMWGSLRRAGHYGYGMMAYTDHMSADEWSEMKEHMNDNYRDYEEMHQMMNGQVDYNKPMAETHSNTHDFGKVSKDAGVVSHNFEIENHGKQTLEIGDISTSCGCTTAEVDKTQLDENETAELTVHFDPNYHQEPEGRFTRSVFVHTNDDNNPELQFDVYIEVTE